MPVSKKLRYTQSMPACRIRTQRAKSIFVTSKLPDADFVANPYTGCQFGCLYCYAVFSCRFVDEPRSAWGEFVVVKENAVELAKTQLARWPARHREANIFLSSITDPYQGIEKSRQLTRGILECLVQAGYQGKVSILTKSPLVCRDIDLLKQLNSDVGITITTTDDQISRFMEVRAPLASKRLQTLHALQQAGIRTYSFIGPLFPHYALQPELLQQLFQKIAASGTREIYAEQLNLNRSVRERLFREFTQKAPDQIALYTQAHHPEHRAMLSAMVRSLANQYNFHLRLGDAIYHQDL